MENHEILLGLTTTPKSDWKFKVKEIIKHDIKKIALFPTYLKLEERRILYDLLAKTGIEEIPHVHLRGDMERWELELFEKRCKTTLFNIHQDEFKLQVFFPYLRMIFVENHTYPVNENALNICAGLCVDFSHLEDGRTRKFSRLDPLNNILDKYQIGCCHISAIRRNKNRIMDLYSSYSKHTLEDITDIDYLFKYKKYFPYYLSIELENSFTEQLLVKSYIEDKIRLED